MRGTPAVYVSEHLSLAVLEQLVHLGRRASKIPFAVAKVSFPKTMAIADIPALPAGWRIEPPADLTKTIGEEWVHGNRTAVLRVPSAIVPSEHNYVLNPRHPDFKRIIFGKYEHFQLDSRLWSFV